MTIYLNRYKAKTVDLKEYYGTYDNNRQTYKLLKGAPLLVNVQGSYVEANDLPKLVCNKCNAIIVNQWLLELRNPTDTDHFTVLNFKWRK